MEIVLGSTRKAQIQKGGIQKGSFSRNKSREVHTRERDKTSRIVQIV
jgi:hypothetical protein